MSPRFFYYLMSWNYCTRTFDTEVLFSVTTRTRYIPAGNASVENTGLAPVVLEMVSPIMLSNSTCDSGVRLFTTISFPVFTGLGYTAICSLFTAEILLGPEVNC